VFAFRPHTAGGDLVLLHAIGVHGLVLLGMPAMLLAGRMMSERERLLRVRLLVGSVVVGLVVLAAHALRQQPWDSLAAWEYTVAAAAVLVYLGTLAEVVARGRPRLRLSGARVG
jgi:peptidoglycan biosynthesis protein MviN/MurJ (putative lipid II flippase)